MQLEWQTGQPTLLHACILIEHMIINCMLINSKRESRKNSFESTRALFEALQRFTYVLCAKQRATKPEETGQKVKILALIRESLDLSFSLSLSL
jgi:hypothetical protein